MSVILPILEPSPTETLAERCLRLAAEVEDYERDLECSLLDLTAIRNALAEAAEALR